MLRSSAVFTLSIWILVTAGTCPAQLETGAIVGIVQDPSGAVVPGAQVVIENVDTASKLSLSTDETGNYIAPVLRRGTYRVTVSGSGFKTVVRDGIALSVGDRRRVDFTLELGATSETVTVAGTVSMVQAASAALGTSVSNAQVTNLPLNGRSIANLLGLAPGVVSLGPFSANGATTNWFASGIHFTVDGGDASQIDSDFIGAAYNSNQRLTRASVDAIQELQIQTGSFSAEYGQSHGALFNIVTKSGTNEYHGSLFEYFRNNKLDARDFFNPAPGYKPSVRLNQFGGTLGGPIVRDKLFFFTNYEGIRQTNGVTFNVLVPTAAFRAGLSPVLRPYADQLPLPNGPQSAVEPRLATYRRSTANALDENVFGIKADYHIAPSDTLSVRWNRNGSLTHSYFGVALGQARPVEGLLQTGRIGYTKVFSPNVYNEASVHVNRMRYIDGSADVELVRNEPIVGSFGNGSAGIGPTLFDIRVGNTSYTYLDTLAWVKGRNQFKFGGQVIRNQQNKGLRDQQSITFQTLDQFASNKPYAVGTLGYGTCGVRITYFNLFAQDDIQVNRKLTLNLGVRYQHDSVPSEATGRFANFNLATGDLDPVGTPVMETPKFNLAPRIGFAYSPFTPGKTVVRGSYGLFYADINVAQVQEFLSNISGSSKTELSLQNPNLVAYPFPASVQSSAVRNVWGIPKTGFKLTYAQQWSLNIQQQLTDSMMFEIGYVGNRMLHLAPVVNHNRIIIGTSVRPNPRWGSINFYEPCCDGNYNGLQLSLKRRLTRRLAINAHYTWSHELDMGGAMFSLAVQDDHNWPGEYASGNTDIRHYFHVDYVYELPAVPGLPKLLGRGWQINGITNMRSGTPVNVTSGVDAAGIGQGAQRPNYVRGVPWQPSDRNVPNGPQINIAAFTRPPARTFGEVSRNLLRGPGAVVFDLSLFKRFYLTERKTVEFRVEAFNAFNHPNFSNPQANLNAPARFGQSTGLSSAMRQMQLALRFDF